MGRHDAALHAVAIQPSLPYPGRLLIDLDLLGHALTPSFDAITCSDPDTHRGRLWTLAGHDFRAQSCAPGFTQHLRRRPIHATRQRLSVEQRGGISFDEVLR
jgi:hypothetical protein